MPDCGSPAKHPRVAGGVKTATTDLAQIESWWRKWPTANVAIRTGAASGLVVIDVDPDHDGEISLTNLVRECGQVPEGRVVSTGGGGRHLYFRHPGTPVRNDVGRRLGPGIDVRGDGGYVLAPPSRHVSGKRYVVAMLPTELPELPDWISQRLQPVVTTQERPIAQFHRVGDATQWAKAALEGELQRLNDARPGRRNDTLNRVAFRLGQVIAGGQLDETDVAHLLVSGALAIGLGEREAVTTIQSGLNAGLEVPRGPRTPEIA
jgi:hypothetical protein